MRNRRILTHEWDAQDDSLRFLSADHLAGSGQPQRLRSSAGARSRWRSSRQARRCDRPCVATTCATISRFTAGCMRTATGSVLC
jgi:hypothetical protein